MNAVTATPLEDSKPSRYLPLQPMAVSGNGTARAFDPLERRTKSRLNAGNDAGKVAQAAK